MSPPFCRRSCRGTSAVLMASVLAALAGVGPPAQSPAAEVPSPPVPGRFTLTTKSGDFDRRAQLQIPAAYRASRKLPLVLLLHGAGGTGVGVLDRNGWAAKADREGFIAVAPDGLPARPRSPADFRTNPQVWNSTQLNERSPRAAIDDVAFLRQLLDELKEKVPYDEGRVYCAGHSNGGAMTFRLAGELSDCFAAIGNVAGAIILGDAGPKKPLPTLYMIGTKDPLMPVDGGEVKLPWGGTRQNRPIAEPLADWAEAIGCHREPQTVFDKDGVKKVEYPSLNDGPTLTVFYLAGHGHHWPGGHGLLPERLAGPNASKLDATDALWEFFAKHGGAIP